MASDFAGNWAANPQYQQRIAQLLPQIRQVQHQYGLPDEAVPYILANAGIESRWNPNTGAGSANDVGLLQITPILAKDYNAPHTNDLGTQLNVVGQYYQRGLKQGLGLDTLATGWNTGMGRAKQVESGQRTWDSITPMAARYNRAVNNFVSSPATQQFLAKQGINYNPAQRTPAVSRTMQQYGIVDRGPQNQPQANLPDLSSGLTGMPAQSTTQPPMALQPPQPVTQRAAPADQPASQIPMTDLQLDGILHTDLGLGERLF